MKKIIIITLCLIAVGIGEACAQGKVWEMTGVTTDTSIVRNWNGGKYVVYNRQSSARGTFTYHDNASGTVMTDTLPAGMVINDFRIMNDTIFAGGYMEGAYNQGVLVCMNIHSLISGSGNSHWFILPPRSLSFSNCNIAIYSNLITSIKRIALFHDGRSVRVAFVAENQIVESASMATVYYRTGYGDAAFLTGIWTMGPYHYNKDGVELYTDIAVTEDKIVIPARTNDSARFKFQVFEKVANFATPPPSNWSDRFGFTDHEVTGRVMTTGLTDNDAAMAYQYKGATTEGWAVKVFDMGAYPPVLMHSVEIPESPGAPAEWEMNDIRYNPLDKELMILCGMKIPSNGTTQEYILRLPIAGIASGTLPVNYLPLMEKMKSLDNFGNGGFIVSGGYGASILAIHNEQFNTPGHCGAEYYTNSIMTKPKMNLNNRHHCTVIHYNNTSSLPFISYELPIDSICND